MDYIRKTYGVPAKRGARIRFCGKHEGTITSAVEGYIRVRFDDDDYSQRLHPTWEVEYLNS